LQTPPKTGPRHGKGFSLEVEARGRGGLPAGGGEDKTWPRGSKGPVNGRYNSETAGESHGGAKGRELADNNAKPSQRIASRCSLIRLREKLQMSQGRPLLFNSGSNRVRPRKRTRGAERTTVTDAAENTSPLSKEVRTPLESVLRWQSRVISERNREPEIRRVFQWTHGKRKKNRRRGSERQLRGENHS